MNSFPLSSKPTLISHKSSRIFLQPHPFFHHHRRVHTHTQRQLQISGHCRSADKSLVAERNLRISNKHTAVRQWHTGCHSSGLWAIVSPFRPLSDVFVFQLKSLSTSFSPVRSLVCVVLFSARFSLDDDDFRRFVSPWSRVDLLAGDEFVFRVDLIYA